MPRYYSLKQREQLRGYLYSEESESEILRPFYIYGDHAQPVFRFDGEFSEEDKTDGD